MSVTAAMARRFYRSLCNTRSMGTPDNVLSSKTRTLLAGCSRATLSTQLFKRGLRNQVMQGVSRLTPRAPTLVGEAYTLRNIPAREDIDHVGIHQDPAHPQRKAIETVPPGRVLVIDCRGDA